MGCSGVRHRFSEEDEAIEIETAALGFRHDAAPQADWVFRKYSSDLTVNKNQLKASVAALKLHFTNYEKHIFIERFVASLKVPGQDVYSLPKLLVLGALLGEADLDQKAKTLFEIVDREESWSIDPGKLVALLSLWADIAIDLGLLVGDGQSHGSTDNRNKDFIGKCRDSKERWIETFKKAIGPGIISKETFVKVSTTQEKGAFLSPSGLRLYLAADAMDHPKVTVSTGKNAFAKFRSDPAKGSATQSVSEASQPSSSSPQQAAITLVPVQFSAQDPK